MNNRIIFVMKNKTGERYSYNNITQQFVGNGPYLQFLNDLLVTSEIGQNPFLAIQNYFESKYTISYSDPFNVTSTYSDVDL